MLPGVRPPDTRGHLPLGVSLYTDLLHTINTYSKQYRSIRALDAVCTSTHITFLTESKGINS